MSVAKGTRNAPRGKQDKKEAWQPTFRQQLSNIAHTYDYADVGYSLKFTWRGQYDVFVVATRDTDEEGAQVAFASGTDFESALGAINAVLGRDAWKDDKFRKGS